MSLSVPSVFVISSMSAHRVLPAQSGSQLALRTYANITAIGCPLDAEVYFIDPACDLEQFKTTLKDPQIKSIIVLLTKDALEDEQVITLARTAIQGTKGRYICHIVHYFWDQDKISGRMDLNGCTMLPNTDGNNLINLFTRLAMYNLTGS